MNAADLKREMFAAAGRIEQRHLDMIIKLGVSPIAVAQLGLVYPAIGVVDADRHGEGGWEPGEGPSHLVQPVLVADQIVDIIAWRSLRPDDWALRTGAAWALGEDILRSRGWVGDAPLLVHPTPLAWLASGGEGLCVVDWKSPDIRQLAEVDAIEVDDDKFGAILLREITRPVRTPRLKIRRRRNVA